MDSFHYFLAVGTNGRSHDGTIGTNGRTNGGSRDGTIGMTPNDRTNGDTPDRKGTLVKERGGTCVPDRVKGSRTEMPGGEGELDRSQL